MPLKIHLNEVNFASDIAWTFVASEELSGTKALLAVITPNTSMVEASRS